MELVEVNMKFCFPRPWYCTGTRFLRATKWPAESGLFALNVTAAVWRGGGGVGGGG
jgi:hypothetical protein